MRATRGDTNENPVRVRWLLSSVSDYGGQQHGNSLSAQSERHHQCNNQLPAIRLRYPGL
jgi:hypothetical protein